MLAEGTKSLLIQIDVKNVTLNNTPITIKAFPINRSFLRSTGCDNGAASKTVMKFFFILCRKFLTRYKKKRLSPKLLLLAQNIYISS